MRSSRTLTFAVTAMAAGAMSVALGTPASASIHSDADRQGDNKNQYQNQNRQGDNKNQYQNQNR